MGKLIMLKETDNRKIEQLKIKLGAKTKVEVIRSALELLEEKADRIIKAQQWKKAAQLVQKSSAAVMKEFQKNSRLRHHE
jgi:hypothetical protein